MYQKSNILGTISWIFRAQTALVLFIQSSEETCPVEGTDTTNLKNFLKLCMYLEKLLH